MTRYPAVVVHGLPDARLALSAKRPVTLLSGEGAGLYGGCLWWRELATVARREHPGIPCDDILDCADAPGRALAALRIGQRRIVLWREAASFAAVAAIAAELGAEVLTARPPALDLAAPGAGRRLRDWLGGAAAGDSAAPVG